MKIRYVSSLLFVVGMGCFSGSGSVAAQITFVQTPPRNQDQDSNRQTLPPDKRRSLPGLGPDELFSDDQEQKPSTNQSKRPSNRQRSPATPSPTPSPTPLPTPSPTSLPAPGTAEATTSPSPAAERLPPKQAPTTAPVGAALSSPLPPSSSTGWQLPALGLLTLLVSVALFYVLGKLRGLLREGSN